MSAKAFAPSPDTLLGPDDPPPVNIINSSGRSPFLLIGDHAGKAVPRKLGSLGISEAELSRHIGWDIGIAELGAILSEGLDAAFIHQSYSRLVVDCNRAPDRPDATPEISDGTEIPANRNLTAEERARRFTEIHAPYHAAIAAGLARRDAAGMPTAIVALHSFTPTMKGGEPRPWQVGILHDRGNLELSGAVLAELRREAEMCVGDNEPYRMDEIDYTIPYHAYPALRPCVEIEVRQDLLATSSQCRDWARVLARVLAAAHK